MPYLVILTPGHYKVDSSSVGSSNAAPSLWMRSCHHLCGMWTTGHSQGTTMALAAFSENAALSAKIYAAALLAPVAFLQHLNSPPIKQLATLDTDEVLHRLHILPSRNLRSVSDSANTAVDAVHIVNQGAYMSSSSITVMSHQAVYCLKHLSSSILKHNFISGCC